MKGTFGTFVKNRGFAGYGVEERSIRFTLGDSGGPISQMDFECSFHLLVELSGAPLPG